MFRSSVYLGSLTLVCALFYLGSAVSVTQADPVAICRNVTTPVPSLDPATPRGSATDKGSVVVFSKIEIKWDSNGNLIRDTFLDLTNDYPEDVYVQGYFINGDKPIERILNEDGSVHIAGEPGWNTADCRFQLTGSQPVWWSAARGGSHCQAFTVLDFQGPGRPDLDAGDGSKILRGYAVFWAVKFERTAGPTGAWLEINWNHLKGDAVIVDYTSGAAWEYNGFSLQAIVSSRGLPTGTPGALLFGTEYEAGFRNLIWDFYRPNSSVASSPDNPTTDVTVLLDTELTLHPMDIDLRQDGCGPVLTKAEFEICNESETCFGTTRCVCCWDSFRLSLLSGISFGTDKLKARIDGVNTDTANCQYSEVCGIDPLPRKATCGQVCDYARCPGPGCPNFALAGFSQRSPLLGVAVKRLSYSPGQHFDMAGMSLQGAGSERAVILYDLEKGPSEIRKDLSDRSTDAR